jgi:hypothetical protein
MFFKSEPIRPAVEEALADTLRESPPSSVSEVEAQARGRATGVVSRASGLTPQWMAFAVAAGVFLILLAAAAYLAGQADMQPADVDTQLRELSTITRELLLAWSGAVLGLIAGEAVGKKSWRSS